MTSPQIVAHQGGAGQWPANSLLAFREVARSKADGVELDVHMTADGQIVVAHDTVAVIDGRLQPIAALEYRQLQYRYAEEGLYSSLQDVVAILHDCLLDIQIDIKSDLLERPYSRLLPILATIIGQFALHERVILSSFSPQVLKLAQALLPACRLRSGLMPLVTEQLGGVPAAISLYRSLGVSILDLNVKLCHPEIVALARAAAMEVGVGTVNGTEAIAHWIQQPIDRLITDEPDAAWRIRQAQTLARQQPVLAGREEVI
jgi:glycerophosphoryl diester phosphodiesterase